MSLTRAATIALVASVGSALVIPAAHAATLDILGIKVEIPTLSQEDLPAPAPEAPAPAPTPTTRTTVRRSATKVRAQVTPVDVPTTAAPVDPAVPVTTPAPAPSTTPVPAPSGLPGELVQAPVTASSSGSGSGFVSLLGDMLVRMLAITVWLVAAGGLLMIVRRRGPLAAV
jgi:hypothetical protein